MPPSSVAQQWTPEQEQVWQFELRCLDMWQFELRCLDMTNAEPVAQCFHAVYAGWNAGDPLPGDWQAPKDAVPCSRGSAGRTWR